MKGWAKAATLALAALTLACATPPAREISERVAERLELREDDELTFRVTDPESRHPIYLRGAEITDGAVIVVEVRF